MSILGFGCPKSKFFHYWEPIGCGSMGSDYSIEGISKVCILCGKTSPSTDSPELKRRRDNIRIVRSMKRREEERGKRFFWVDVGEPWLVCLECLYQYHSWDLGRNARCPQCRRKGYVRRITEI